MWNRQILPSSRTPHKSARKNQGPKNIVSSSSVGGALFFIIPSDTRSTKSEKPPMYRAYLRVLDSSKYGAETPPLIAVGDFRLMKAIFIERIPLAVRICRGRQV